MEETSGGSDAGRRGLGGSLRSLATGVVGLVAAHVELFGVELQEEKQRLIELAVLGACALALFAMTLLLATFAIVIWLWDHYRLESVFALAVLYALAGAIVVFILRKKLESHPNPFAASAEELEKDRERLLP